MTKVHGTSNFSTSAFPVELIFLFLPFPAHRRVQQRINYLQSQRNCNLKIPCVCTTTFIIMKMIYCVNMALARNQIRKHFLSPLFLVHDPCALGATLPLFWVALCAPQTNSEPIPRGMSSEKERILIKTNAKCQNATSTSIMLGRGKQPPLNLMKFVFIIFMKVKMLFALMRNCVLLAA